MATPQPVDARTQPWRETPGGDLVALGRPVRQALHLVRHNPAQGRVLSRRETILLVLFALTLHGAVIHWLSQQRTPALPEVPPQVPPMTIEFTAPAPPVVEPPPPEPLPPVVEEPPPPVVDENAVKPPPPKPVPKPKPKPKPQPRPKPAPKAVEPAPPAPPQPAAPPTPPAPAAAPAPLTPPSANAGYLHNPAPEYPALAMRRGWEGTVLLRVHVLASGSPSEIQVQKSSGREALDQAAVKAVKRWSFVPAKRGDKAEDGWVSVPIDFKLN
ncbi:energy transducer TonB [Pseudomonas aeruginosa]|nr:energy transducer TonB [Pseudomonas aeruginosa]ELM3843744.1 energy transducer TonB [Pseudomonas aeruginosa]ELP2774197.1 energy transducer TonB [Pseudomonas aeruginosa]ELX8339438.1 energy transducer TonB [Pseudomonas aeruginosa]ELY0901022.1 energy transducer TonB [Pseudomonas aeruginosa]